MIRVPAMRILFAVLLTAAAFTVAGHGPASKVEATDRVIQFPDTPNHRVLKIDLHTHSVFSDGHVWPRTRVEEALRDGLDALAITEHLEWQPHLADLPHVDRNRAFEIAREAATDTDLIIIAGSEITREAPAGHVNAVFIKDANRLLMPGEPSSQPFDAEKYYEQANRWPAREALLAARAQDAFVFWNHPYWTDQTPSGIATLPNFHKLNIEADLLHGIEIANGATYSEEAFQIALDHDLTLIGVSDVHNLIDWDYEPHNGGHRPVTLVLAKEKSASAIRNALFDGRTVVWFRNLLMGREPHLRPVVQSSIQVVSAEYVNDEVHIVKLTLRNRSDARFQLQNKSELTFMNHGDLIELPPNDDFDLYVKPGSRVPSMILSFNVINALTAPKTPLTLDMQVDITM